MDIQNVAYTNIKTKRVLESAKAYADDQIEEALDALTAADVPTSDSSTVQAKLTSYATTLSNHSTTIGEHTSQLAAKAMQTHLTEKTGYGVISGLGVTAHGTPDMAVAIAAGVAWMDSGTRYSPAAVASLAVTAADTTNPRKDIVYLSSAGVVSYLAGSAAATPSAPATPTGGLLLAEITVAAGVTTVTAANIASRRKSLLSEEWIYPTLLNGWANVAGETSRYVKGADGFVDAEVAISGGTGAAFTLPAGYRIGATSVVGGNTATATLHSNGSFTPSTTAGSLRFRFRFRAEG